MKLTDKARAAITNATSVSGDYTIQPGTHHSTRRSLVRNGLVQADGWTLTAKGEELRTYLRQREADTAQAVPAAEHAADVMPIEVLVNEVTAQGPIAKMDMSADAVARRERAAKLRDGIKRTLAVLGRP